MSSCLYIFLVHSRIRRVFFSMNHEKDFMGGLNKNLSLNNCDNLNHKFSVFFNVGREDCLDKRKSLKLL